MFDAPIFTQPLELEIAGDDPLGLAPTNERLYNSVYPGVNNVVRYIRVYSAICWAVHQIDKYFKVNAANLSEHEAKRISTEALEKVQLALVWVNQAKGYPQIAGLNRLYPTDNRTIDLTFDSLGSSKVSLLDAVAYRPSLTSGLGLLEARANGTFACTQAGESLADAFESNAKSSKGYAWLRDVTALQTSRMQVFELEDVLDVGLVTPKEQAAFLAQFFPARDRVNLDSLTQNRWLSLHLTLRAVEGVCESKRAKGHPELASEGEVRGCMARGVTTSCKPLPLKEVAYVQAVWAVLQVRQLQRLALDVLYCVVERWLGRACIESLESSIANCANEIGLSAIASLEEGFRDSISVLIESFRRAQGSDASLYVASCRAESPDDREMMNVFSHIDALLSMDKDFDEHGGNRAAARAYVALVLCAVETNNLLLNRETEDVIRRDNDWCSMLSLTLTVDRMQGQGAADFLSHIVKNWVILRHFQIVADRSQGGDEKNRFRFVIGERGLERFNPALPMPAVGIAQDRLEHILELCYQSELLEREGSQYKLTKYGRGRMLEAL